MSVPTETGPRVEQVPVISVGVDGSAAGDAALSWALDEAARRGDSVLAVNVLPLPFMGTTPWAPPDPDLGPGSPAYLEVQAAIHRVGYRGPVPIEIDCRFGSIGFALDEEAEAAGAELVVIGRSDGGLGHDLFLGSLSHFLCHTGNRPAVVVPPAGAGGSGRPDVIVAGVDGTNRGRIALRWALHEAGIRGATVRAVLTWDDSQRGPGTGAVLVVPDTERTAAEQAASILRSEVAGALRDEPGVSVTAVAVRGSAGHVLLRESEGADLLVLGDHKRLVVGEVVLGSTTRTCLHRASCPVAIVPGPADQPVGQSAVPPL